VPGGKTPVNLSSEHSGGGGGAHAGSNNIALNPGDAIAIAIGVGSVNGGVAGDTSFGAVVLAKGANGRLGGKAAECIGDVVHDGGDGHFADGVKISPAGGAAGPHGAGGTGGALVLERRRR
jgi:hypothetical protein